MAKLTAKEIAKLRAEYLERRESFLKGKVNALQVTLFDKVFNRYLLALQDENGRILDNPTNRNIVAGLDKIYKEFNSMDNMPVIKTFLGSAEDITNLNSSYFKAIDKAKAKVVEPEIKKIVNKQLGLKEDGTIKKGGFTDKFIRDESVLKKIKKLTSQAISKGKDFTALQKELKEYIVGNPDLADSGGLQQYYKNYAYDTLHKVDALNQQEFGSRLELRYFQYIGGLIKSSRNFCIHYNGKIIDSHKFSKLTYESLPENQRDGIPTENWNPMVDRGGYNCRHQINWISTPLAEATMKDTNAMAEKRTAKFEKIVNK